MNEFKDKVKLIILYGSYARGDYKQDSDVNILLVIDDLHNLRPIDRYLLLMDVIDNYVIEPHIYTPNEFIELVKQCSMTAYDALTYGITLYKDEEFYKIICNELRKAVEKYKPIRTY